MPINKNHEFEDLQGIKCAIVEKNTSGHRMEFLKQLLEFNNYSVIVLPVTPAPPAAKVIPAAEGDIPAQPLPESPAPELPTTYTIGVTDVTFNPTNAIFGRLLKTKEGNIVTLAYWHQKEPVSNDTIPYFQKKS